MTLQAELDARYTAATPEELDARIAEVRARLGSRLVILGHHYQCDEVVRHADYLGDSFKLARQATRHPEAEYIVFCGVHFMAESADVLTPEHQTVLLLRPSSAGCPMADMANIDQLEIAWEELTAIHGPDSYVPITYMNSSAAIKAFCGRHGGTVCTSSNARTVYRWALEQEKRIIFLPDQHLGRNVGFEMGIPLDQMVLWNPLVIADDNLPRGVADAKVVLWQGHCSVHGRFTPEHVDQVRERIPGVRVIAHPECSFEVVQKSDEHGSTEHIIKAVSESPAGSKWAIGTEIHLVHRLASENPDKTVVSLSGIACLCSTMYRIDPPHLLWCLESIEAGAPRNIIKVDAETAHWARVALDKMLELA
ncbi:MAG: quinolinate synthase NadA [Planctomycetota bacterium]